MARIVIFILAAFTPAIICLFYAWRANLDERAPYGSAVWRARILTIGVWLAALSQLLLLSFLLQGFHEDRQSFAEPAPLSWAVVNWVALSGWAFAVIFAAIGQGKGRIALALWTAIAPITAWFVFLMGYDY